MFGRGSFYELIYSNVPFEYTCSPTAAHPIKQGSVTSGPRARSGPQPHMPFVNINPARLPLHPARDPSAKEIIICNQSLSLIN